MPNEMTIEEWLEWMRKPASSHYVQTRILFPDAEFPGEDPNDFTYCLLDCNDDDFLETVRCENSELDDRLCYCEAVREFQKVSQYAGLAPKAMAFLRSQPPSGNVYVPRPEESEWMSPKERDLVEWLDRGEYGVFMRLCAFFDLKEGWIVRCCANFSILFGKGIDGSWPSLVPLKTDALFDAELVGKIRAAADGGNARALNCLGVLSERGYSGGDVKIKVDPVAARDYYRRSAEAGCTSGKSNYARVLGSGVGGGTDLCEAERIYRELSARGLGSADFELAGLLCDHCGERGSDLAELAEAMLRAAKRGNDLAKEIVAAAQGDLSPERLAVEYLFFSSGLVSRIHKKAGNFVFRTNPRQFLGLVARELDLASISKGGLVFSVSPRAGDASPRNDVVKAARDRKLVADRQPPGAVVPPAGGRETVRTPNLASANPSFAARLVMYVRDRFDGDAPKVYIAAHVSRKTYSSIVSNELRPVSKPTAILLALGLRLNFEEAEEFIKSAGFAFSAFILEDIVVSACIKAGIHDVSRVNEILSAHRAKPFPAAEDDCQLEEQKGQ